MKNNNKFKSKAVLKPKKLAGGTPSLSAIGSAIDPAAKLVGSIGDAMITDDATKGSTKTGKSISSAAKYAGMGASIGSIVPGLGTVIGGAAGLIGGGIAGIIGANKDATAQLGAEAVASSAKNVGEVNAIGSRIKADYDLKNSANTRIPGLRKGTGSTSSDIMPVEPILSPSKALNTNINTIVPSKNKASLKRDMKVPMGADSIAYTDYRGAEVRSNSVDFAKRFQGMTEEVISNNGIGRQDALAQVYNKMGVNSLGLKSKKYPGDSRMYMPKFKQGSPSTIGANAIVANEEVIQDGNTKKLSVVPGQYDKSNPDKVPVNMPEGSSVFSNQESQALPFGGSTPAELAKRAASIEDSIEKKENSGKKMSKLDMLTARLNKRAIASATHNLNKFNALVAPENTEDPSAIQKYKNGTASSRGYRPTLKKYDPGVASTSLFSSLGGQKEDILPEDKLIYKPVAKMEAPALGFKSDSTPVWRVKEDATRSLLQEFGSPAEKTFDGGAKEAVKDPDLFNNIMSKVGSVGSTIASLAPMFHNMNATAEVEAPIYEDRMNVRNRYNIAPQMAESVKQRNIARFNNSMMNRSTGQSMAVAGDLYSRGIDSASAMYDNMDKANVGYDNAYANNYNQESAGRAVEQRRVRAINQANQAKARDFSAKNAEMISEFAQNKQKEANRKKADVLNSNIWNTYSTATDPKMQEYLMKLIKDYSSN